MLRKRCLALAMGLLWFAPVAMAQHKDWKSWYGEFSVGYSAPQITAEAPDGGTLEPLENGWNIAIGAVLKPRDWPLGIYMELGYNTFDVNGELLEQIGVGGGSSDIWSLTGGFLWSTDTGSPVNFYVRGGVGWYRISAKLTEPGIGFQPPWCGWYWCFPGGFVPIDATVASGTTTRFGYSAGIGLSFMFGSGSEIFLEARYHWAQTTNEATEYLPVSVGIRW